MIQASDFTTPTNDVTPQALNDLAIPIPAGQPQAFDVHLFLTRTGNQLPEFRFNAVGINGWYSVESGAGPVPSPGNLAATVAVPMAPSASSTWVHLKGEASSASGGNLTPEINNRISSGNTLTVMADSYSEGRDV